MRLMGRRPDLVEQRPVSAQARDAVEHDDVASCQAAVVDPDARRGPDAPGGRHDQVDRALDDAVDGPVEEGAASEPERRPAGHGTVRRQPLRRHEDSLLHDATIS